MQLFIDIDGVLLNFEHTFVAWLNREHRLGLPADYQAHSWDFEEVMDKQTLHQSWLDFLDSPASGQMPPLIDPRRFNGWAREHSVHLVTNFPQPHMEKRERNLKTLGFDYDSLHYCGLHGYQDLLPVTKAQAVAGLRQNGEQALFLDDNPDNCLDVHANCPEVEVWLMSRRFNRDFQHPSIQRALDWNCLFDRLDNPNGGNVKRSGQGNGV